MLLLHIDILDYSVRVSLAIQYEMHAPANRKRIRGASYQSIDDAVFQWYSLARESLIPVSGPMLQEEALLIAQRMENNEF